MAAKKKKRSKKKSKKQKKQQLKRYLRGAGFILVIAAIVFALGSYLVRREVLARVRSRAISTSSVILSRPFPITRGTNYNDAKIERRLKRLKYTEVNSYPRVPGQYSKNNSKAYIYLRDVDLPNGETQKKSLIELNLDQNFEILSLKNSKHNKRIRFAWLEPEVISLLGNSSSRATNYKKLNEFPENLKNAVLSIEDERFYSHIGLDFIAIARAFYVNLTSGKLKQGGSTLTQQLAKNLFFTNERSLRRKILEAISAIFIETGFSKDQILEYYLNEIYLGQSGNQAIHGFAKAATHYFGKEIEKLRLSEIATLAGIIKGPSYYSPRRHPIRAKKRRRTVLKKMHELGYISKNDRDGSGAVEVKVIQSKSNERIAPYFVDYLRKTITTKHKHSIKSDEALRIHSGIDLEFQKCAEYAVDTGLKKINENYQQIRKSKEPLQAAIVALNPNSGEIRAWVGGKNYSQTQFDRVSQAKRQPGSTFKPFVYLTALDRNLNNYRVARTTSLLLDEPIKIPSVNGTFWEPKNYDGEFRGEVTVREALTYSLNIPTVELAEKVGIDAIAHTAELFGFGKNLPHVPSLALGAGEVTPLELARAYAAIANGGALINLQEFSSITTAESKDVIVKNVSNAQKTASEGAVYVLTNILQSVIEHGTGKVVRRMGFEGPVAGKTGTSNDTRDAWFAGFTPRLLAVVWVGFDNNKPTHLTGSSGAAPIWTRFMNCVSKMEPVLDFIAPPDVVFKRIDPNSGLLHTERCKNKDYVAEVFVKGTEPVTTCPNDSRRSWEMPWDRNSSWRGERRRSKTRSKRVKDAFSELIDSLF